MSEDKDLNPQDPQTPRQSESWEPRLQERANEFLAKRIAPLVAEIETLQSTINEISSRLLEQAQTPPTEQDTEGLFDHVRNWFNQSKAEEEENIKARLAAASEEAAKEFEQRLEEARRGWEEASQQTNEEAFQKRLEQACSEAAAVARRESQDQIEDLTEQLEASRKALTLAVSSAQSASALASRFETLKTAIEDIDIQRSQSDTLTALVRRAAQFAPRVVFFVVKGGDAIGWKASGFENGLNDETVRLLTVPTSAATLLSEALNNFRTAVGRSASPGENSAVLGLYGSPAPERAIAVPLVVRGKAAAVLYADSGTQSGDSINSAAIETLIRVSGMGIELLPARRNLEVGRTGVTGQLTPPPAAPAAAPAPAPEEKAAPQPVPAVETTAETAEQQRAVAAETGTVETPVEPRIELSAEEAEKTRITEDLPRESTAEDHLQEAESQAPQPAEIEAEPEEMGEAVSSVYEAETISGEEIEPEADFVEAELVESVEESEVAPPSPPAAPMPPISRKDDDWMASAPTVQIKSDRTTLDLPPEIRNQPASPSAIESTPESPSFTSPPEPQRQAQPMASVPTPASETEQRAHNDARRFARLLVSEIKLYNAAKVNDGRRNFDLYERLKDEIDRSRKVYDKRVSPAVAARFDYFYDELVQTLAEGDPAKLGPGCPGPVVLAS